jgi:hypothetical protein
MFRIDMADPHPSPWIRVMLSCAIGRALYPHRQWARFEAMWAAFYPPSGLAPDTALLLDRLRATMPAFVSLLVQHRPRSLHGRTLAEVLHTQDRQPVQLGRLFRHWSTQPAAMYRASPSLVFAVIGQARADGRVSPEDESRLLGKLLTHWALASTLQGASLCAHAGAPAL